MSTFDFKPHEVVPFKDRKVLEEVRNIKRAGHGDGMDRFYGHVIPPLSIPMYLNGQRTSKSLRPRVPV
jgi:hypothetical protein